MIGKSSLIIFFRESAVGASRRSGWVNTSRELRPETTSSEQITMNNGRIKQKNLTSNCYLLIINC